MSDPNAHADIVRLTTAANPVQAHIWQEALEQEGIKARVVGDYLDAGVGDIPGISPEIWVRREDLARAEETLRQYGANRRADEEAPEDEE